MENILLAPKLNKKDCLSMISGFSGFIYRSLQTLTIRRETANIRAFHVDDM